ncbi:MAG: signal peptidase II [Proteocatella sp.]
MLYTLIIITLLALDQISKFWARNILAIKGSIPVISEFLHLTYVENRGAAFGILSGKITLFLAVTALAIILLIRYANSQKDNDHARGLYLIIVFIIAGALGNLIDRAMFGFVTDMIDFRGIWKFVFNVADCYVVCGTSALIFYILKFDKTENS